MFVHEKKEKIKLEYFDEFLAYMTVERNASKFTISSYTSDFRILEEYLKERNMKVSIETLNVATIRTFIHFLRLEKEYTNETIRRKIYALGSFFKFLVENEYIGMDKNPMSKIRAPKKEEKLPIYLSEKEIRTLLDTIMKTGGKDAIRDKAIISLFAMTGLRRMELINLNWEDVDFGQKTIKVTMGKGKKQRILPMPETLYQDLLAYMNNSLPITNPALFITTNNKRVNFRGMNNLFQKYIKRAGLSGKGYTLHKLRHSYASLLVQQGVDISIVKELMGHTDFNSTKIYVHLNMNNLRDSVDKHPLSHI